MISQIKPGALVVTRVRWRIGANVLGIVIEVEEEHCIVMWSNHGDFELRRHPIDAITIVCDENIDQIEARCNLNF